MNEANPKLFASNIAANPLIRRQMRRAGFGIAEAGLAHFVVCTMHPFEEGNVTALVNERQRKLLNRYFDGFEGNLPAHKGAASGNCSIPTAQRDIADLIAHGVRIRNPAGRKSSGYSIPLSADDGSTVSTSK